MTKVRFYIVEEKGREVEVSQNFGHGVTGEGDEFEIANAARFVAPDPTVDVACAFALKGNAKNILAGYKTMGAHTVLVDKGLIRPATGLGAPGGYHRVSLDSFMPISRIKRMMAESVSPERWVATGMEPINRDRQKLNGHIIFAGSSQKYCDFHGLGLERDYAIEIIRMIRKRVGKRAMIIYRPKPSYLGATPIDGTVFSRSPQNLAGLLPKARCLVTHGSHAAIDAILGGVPAIVLGESAALPVSSANIDDLHDFPMFYPDRATRFHWLAAIAWWQWLPNEMLDGSCWRFLRSEIERGDSDEASQ